MKRMQKASLSIPFIEYCEDFPKDKKVAINAIIKVYEEEANVIEKKIEKQISEGRFRSFSGFHEPIRSGTPGERSEISIRLFLIFLCRICR